ncbi:TRAP transporter substrate-binding protein [Halalkalibacter krulwichiae]|uniref:2,3-diketo-L-gulonate-binding periplasmic protein YiaO n=1 Tax=Halalkalibacter krulwichiae TaxID=199441 RepID=A0A1X9M9R6_9BACI|nr:DctP family TRAP transporter solute-binding subunit [Halalkalibacter krulwichiae]ARK30146.1 2,3-diketo-L-gulonate-binding periplasmic protein YiaO precursor [Halalkalibacter krulwichiae]
MKKLLTSVSICSVLLLAACGGGQSAEPSATNDVEVPEGVKEMKLAVATPEERSLTQGLYKFQEIVESETGGSIKVEVFPNGQLGGDREVFEGLQFGTIEGTTISTGPVAQFAPRFQMFDLPFLFPNTEVAYEILDGSIGEDLLGDLPEQGVIGLNYWENGFRHLTNNGKEVASLEDIKGLKIRTLENELHIDMWRELGANPTPMAFTELFAALQQGVVDGQENPAGNVTTSKFYEVQDYLTKTGHIYNASLFMISETFWNTLTDEEQEIVRKAADEARDYQRELNQQEEIEAFTFLEENGMTIIELSDEAQQKIFDQVQPVYEKYSASIGEELVQELLDAVQ